MKTHNLKCWPEYFEAILQGRKTFEIRYNDRNFAEGDILVLQEYCFGNKGYTGRSIHVEVTYILPGLRGIMFGSVEESVFTEMDNNQSERGIMFGWVVMAIKPIS